MTNDERKELHEQATQLSYLAIRYADLSPLLSCAEWDGLADQIGKDTVALILRRIDQRLATVEIAKEAMRDE